MKCFNLSSKEVSSKDQQEHHQWKHHESLDDDITEQQQIFQTSTSTIFSKSIIKQRGSVSKQLFCKKEFAHKLTVNITNTNFESSIVNLHYGNFSLLCNVLFAKDVQKIFSSLKLLGIGSFGRVYGFEDEGNHYAIKVLNIKDGVTKGFWREFYKEYFLNCLADHLGVSPKMMSLFGYDLLITQNAVIFCMQKCFPLKLNQRQIFENELQQALSVMHSIGFVHLDIKPENIAFSQNLQKHVFIDFGLSSLIRQKVGQKSLTSFKGTLHYCSQEMKKCYILQKKMFVDLYENDKISLKKAFKESNKKYLQQVKKPYINSRNNENEKKLLIKKFCAVLNLKHNIFQNNVQQTYNILNKCVDLPRCCCEIFQSKTTRKQFIEDVQISGLLKIIKEKIYLNAYGQSNIDQQVWFYINEQVRLNILQHCFAIEGIIKMESQNFVENLTKSDFLTKVFLFLDPFESEVLKQVSKEIWIHRKTLLKKFSILLLLSSKRNNQNSFKIS